MILVIAPDRCHYQQGLAISFSRSSDNLFLFNDQAEKRFTLRNTPSRCEHRVSIPIGHDLMAGVMDYPIDGIVNLPELVNITLTNPC
jgi:hypothetical protein